MADVDSFCGGPFQTNGYLVACGDKMVLFDDPMGANEWIQSLGKSVDLLILTHQHHDHIMDAAKLVEAFDCPIWAMEDFTEELTLKASLEASTGKSWDLGEFSVTRKLAEGEDLDIEGWAFEVFHIPGHSTDSLCFFNSEKGFVIGGDVLFQGGIGRTDFPNGSFEQLISGIKTKLWPLPESTVVCPGHGPPTEIGVEKRSNPFVR